MNYYQAKTEGDFKFIASLFSPDHTEYMLTKKVDYKHLMKSGQSEYRHNFIATVDGKKIAWFNLVQSDDLGRVNFGMIVDKVYQGMGYGQQIMEIIENEAKKLGAKKIRLGVFQDNNPAVHIYKKFGFKETGKVINMEKKL
ncbi:GNAT family N-acetyltransferase [Patescibacteria group bacterium]|nr:GNAT family N-acetyltransferase [Patescibacteria group bacterium]